MTSGRISRSGKKSKSSNRQTELDRAIDLMERGRSREASSILLRLAHHNPTDKIATQNAAISIYNVGNEYYDRRQWREAAEKYREAIALDATYVPALYNLGLTYGYLAEYERAIPILRKTLQLQPHHAKAHLALGYIFYDKGVKQSARRHLLRFIALAPDSENVGPVQSILASL